MSDPLIFVLAPAAALPDSCASTAALQAAQLQGPAGGFALRIFSRADAHPDPARLPVDGRLTGDQRRSSDGTQLICDAVVPLVEPQHHWLGVYQVDPDDDQRMRCLDRFALSEASNDTCWFYPTHNGSFLSWERGMRLTLLPGMVVDCPEALAESPYERQLISVLWSLLGDDVSLTCVGLTYGGQRIIWPLRAVSPEPMATWSRFRVDNQAELSPVVEDSRTVFAEPVAEA